MAAYSLTKGERRIVDRNTQISKIEAIIRAWAEVRAASASEEVNRAQRVNTLAGRTEIFEKHGQAYSLKDCLFEFKV